MQGEIAMQRETDFTEVELDEIDRRTDAATVGPWFSLVVGRDMEAGLNCIELGCCCTLELIGGTVADQDFIANARQDVPRLTREVRRLRKILAVQSSEPDASWLWRRISQPAEQLAAETADVEPIRDP